MISIILCLLFISTTSGSRQINVTLGNVEDGATGILTFNQDTPTSNVTITGTVSIPTNAGSGTLLLLHGIHIHEYANVGNECLAAGGHYNPFNASHGGLNTAIRHLGDLGNIQSTNGIAMVNIETAAISLDEDSPLSVVGRTLVIHRSADFFEEINPPSLGPRIGCGILFDVRRSLCPRNWIKGTNNMTGNLAQPCIKLVSVTETYDRSRIRCKLLAQDGDLMSICTLADFFQSNASLFQEYFYRVNVWYDEPNWISPPGVDCNVTMALMRLGLYPFNPSNARGFIHENTFTMSKQEAIGFNVFQGKGAFTAYVCQSFTNKVSEEDSDPYWRYYGENGPEFWAKYDETCMGSYQSPINIDGSLLVSGGGVIPQNIFNRQEVIDTVTRTRWVNNGRQLILAYVADQGVDEIRSTFTGGILGTDNYTVFQLHLHFGDANIKGSQHTVNGTRYDMEIDRYYLNRKYQNVTYALTQPDGILVIVQLVNEDPNVEDGPSFASGVNALAQAETLNLDVTLENITVSSAGVDAEELIWFELPDLNNVEYRGALPFPGCGNNNVQYIVNTQPLTYNSEFFNAIRRLKDDNGVSLAGKSRPLQPLGPTRSVSQLSG